MRRRWPGPRGALRVSATLPLEFTLRFLRIVDGLVELVEKLERISAPLRIELGKGPVQGVDGVLLRVELREDRIQLRHVRAGPAIEPVPDAPDGKLGTRMRVRRLDDP